MIYTPDKWVILKIEAKDETLHKVFATWQGGYLSGSSWKLNSGNKSVTKDIYWYHVHGYSGSIYELHKESYGTSMYTSGVLNSFLEAGEGAIKLLSEEESLEYLENACA